MKISLWCLVALMGCLFTPARSDCQGECVACGLLLQQQQLQEAFNTIVCLLECEGHVSSSLTWEVCKRAVKLSQHPSLAEEGALLKRAGGELTPLDLSAGSEVLQYFQEENLGEIPSEQRSVRYDSSLLESSEEGESLQALGLPDEDGEQRSSESDAQLEGERGDSSEGAGFSKRFGGFQRGRHGYRKVIGSPARPLQKRYGGFIGVRKSARKWNSQKRMNQLLRQYLGMRSNRSGRFNNNNNNNNLPVTRVWRQNKL
ncbi:prepronociceptin b [Kryptolebias marmoratus]|uniref:Prepronociceptin b n=1 Tax=Kryptolebias marmoratus TaxID=37003 RepID=A0A3Q3BA93_KRYMA|nr:prepronociceptin b [Kryptolebias marmoratus]XP_024865369.1 prepronociceptin b [Kryptolebias marmoratus]